MSPFRWKKDVASDDFISCPDTTAGGVRVDCNVGRVSPPGGGAHVAFQEGQLTIARGLVGCLDDVQEFAYNALKSIDAVIKAGNFKILTLLVGPQIADALLVGCDASLKCRGSGWACRDPRAVDPDK